MTNAVVSRVAQRPRVRRPPRSAYDLRFLAPAFRSTERTSVMFWGGVGYGFHTQLVAIKKRTVREHAKDRLGMNSKQYCEEVVKGHLIPLMERMVAHTEGLNSIEDLETIEDGAKIHHSCYAKDFRKEHKVNCIKWPPYSPDMNLIENVWAILKRKLRRQWENVEKRPKGRDELIVAAQLAWDSLNWTGIYTMFERMPKRVSELKRVRGRVTRW